MAKFHGVDYTNNQYITVKTELEEGIYTFQVKVEDQGLVLDVFLHVGDEDEHVITKTAWYEDIGLIKKEESNEEEEYDEHLGCYSYPNCDEGVGGCLVEMGDDAEEYGHKD